jgi:membrane protein DedA with SNARE-associated domain
MLVDIVPLPLPPAFTVMIFFQIYYKLNIWPVIVIGVAGSIAGRTILSLYVSRVSDHIFSVAKNEDVRFLGKKLKEKGWKSQALILIYSLMPLPTTPLFIAGGMARMKTAYIIPPFVIGKFTSDAAAVLLGDYAARNIDTLLKGIISWESVTGLMIGLAMIFALLYIDWRTLLQDRKLRLKFQIWK